MADAEQVTSQTPATKQKNPKHVAAGKAVAEKTRQAREAQKRALAEANVIIANNQLKPAPPAADPPPAPPAADPPPAAKITTAQWLSVISIIISLVGLYYKREEIKGVFARKTPEAPVSHLPAPQRKGGVSQMD